jgi:hypothetical protein
MVGSLMNNKLEMIHLSNLFTSAPNPQHRSLLTVVAANSALPFHHLRLSNVLERIYQPSRETFYETNTSRRKQDKFIYEYPLQSVLLPTKITHNRTLLFGITLFMRVRHFDY